MSRIDKLKEKLDARQRFTKEDYKEVGLAVFENKPVFYGASVFGFLWVLTSAGFFASIGAGTIVFYALNFMKGEK